jgi:hypothetical protein
MMAAISIGLPVMVEFSNLRVGLLNQCALPCNQRIPNALHDAAQHWLNRRLPKATGRLIAQAYAYHAPKGFAYRKRSPEH